METKNRLVGTKEDYLRRANELMEGYAAAYYPQHDPLTALRKASYDLTMGMIERYLYLNHERG